MPGFSIRNPYFIVVVCLVLLVVGLTSYLRMPVDLFPPINRMQTFMRGDACHQRSQIASAAVKFVF